MRSKTGMLLLVVAMGLPGASAMAADVHSQNQGSNPQASPAKSGQSQSGGQVATARCSSRCPQSGACLAWER